MIFRVCVLGLLLVSKAGMAGSVVDEKSQTVASVMAAEYALQNKDIKTAAIEYAKASQSSQDVNLAERATSLAMSAKMTDALSTRSLA